MTYFKTHIELRVSVEHCLDEDEEEERIECDQSINLEDYWNDKGIAIHDINSNIDLTDATLKGKPT